MEELAHLRQEAARCRRLAAQFLDKRTVNALTALADDYERRAREAEECLRSSAGVSSDPAA